MTMHLVGPWLSTTGKSKGKMKWRSSEQKKQAQQLDKEWKELKTRLGIEEEEKKKHRALSSKPLQYTLKPPPGREMSQVRSLDSGVGNASKKVSPVYTGDKIVGIGTMHKSNAVPIFSDSQAKEISSMRR